MTVLRVVQPSVPMSQNAWNTLMFGRSISKAHNARDAWKTAAFYAWKEQRYGPAGAALGAPSTVTVHLAFHENRRRDPHNYVGTVCKWIVDGLVLAGVWPDDNPEWVSVAEPVLVVQDRVPKTQGLIADVHLEPR